MQAESWVEKYRPQKLSDVAGNYSVIEELRKWAKLWEKGTPESKAIIIYGKQGTGKCCKWNTLVLTDKGLIKIEDIVHRQIDLSNRNIDHGQSNLYDSLYNDSDAKYNTLDILKDEDNIKSVNSIISISPRLHYEKYGIIDRYDMGENDIVTIRTKLGLEISGTPEHKIVIIDNDGKLRFKKLQDISTLDHVAISYNTNTFNERLKINFFYRKNVKDNTSQILKNVDYMNPEIAELFGYIIAEGNTHENGVVITNYDKEIVDRILDICKSINLDAREKHTDETLTGVTIGSLAFKEFIYYLGYRDLAQNKEIPWSILQADKDSQVSFIRALFDGDGTVGDHDNHQYVEYNSSSYELCRQLQIMLLNFGIIGRLSSKKGARLEYRGEIREYEESYRLIMMGGELLKFSEIINFGLSRKKEILDRCVRILENKHRWTDVTYPNIEKIINRLYDELKMLGQKGKIVKKWQEDFVMGNKTIKINRQKSVNCKEYLKNCKNIQQSIYGYASGKRRPSIYLLKQILSIMELVDYLPEYTYLETLSDRFIFDNVVTVANGRTKVYDVTVDNVHSYVGNSMINHNTTCAHALANEMGWEIMELNASDQRTKTIIEEIAGIGSRMGTTDGSRRLIILDEADNFYSREDKGGEVATINIILNTLQPMILIANDFYKMKKGLRSSCRSIEFKPIMTSHIMGVLKTIAKSENVTYDVGVIEKIAYNADGDLRGAINDLQAVSSSHIKIEDVTIGERNNKQGIFITLNKIFRASNVKESYEAISNIDQNPEDLIQWIDENIQVEYTRPEDLDNAYYYIAKASTFLARVRRRGDYTMWRYAGFLMTAGVFASSRKRRTEKLRYDSPQIRDKLYKTKSMRAIRDSLSKKIGLRCHTSIGFARSSLLPFFRTIMKNVSYAEYIAASLELSIEEIAFILDENIEAKVVQDAYNKAQLTMREGIECIIESSSEINEKIEEEKSASKYGKAQLNIEDAWG